MKPAAPEAAEIGRQLRRLITVSDRPMRDIAKAAAMDPAQLCRITQGTGGNVQISTVAKVAAALDMELRIVPRGEVSDSDNHAA